jgi:hypothetical protein
MLGWWTVATVCLKAVFLNTLSRRLPDIDQIIVNDSDLTDIGGLRVKPSAFEASHGPKDSKTLGTDPRDIISPSKENKWPSFRSQDLSMQQMALYHALVSAPRGKWSTLWLAVLLRPNMIVANMRGDVFLVVLSSSYLFWAVQLIWHEDALGYTLPLDVFGTRMLTITSLAEFVCHEYDIQLTRDYQVVFTLDVARPLVEFALRHTIHLYSMVFLRKVCCSNP